jgi:hypothetical protein
VDPTLPAPLQEFEFDSMKRTQTQRGARKPPATFIAPPEIELSSVKFGHNFNKCKSLEAKTNQHKFSAKNSELLYHNGAWDLNTLHLAFDDKSVENYCVGVLNRRNKWARVSYCRSRAAQVGPISIEMTDQYELARANHHSQTYQTMHLWPPAKKSKI